MKIVLVGGDLAKKAGDILESFKMRVTVVASREDAEELIGLYAYDILVLAQPEPGIRSHVEKARRAGLALPLIVLSKVSAGEVKVEALNAGADDYIVDPFHAGEFVARVHAVARRFVGHSSSEIVVGGLSIILNQMGLVRINGVQVKLSPKKFELLQMFMRRPGTVFTRQQILDYCWSEVHLDERSVDVHVGRLRATLEEAGGQDYFETVRGVGYLLKVPPKNAEG